MGRWSQRRRRGAGGQLATIGECTYIVNAFFTDESLGIVRVNFSRVVDFTQWAAGDFRTMPSSNAGQDYLQLTPTQVEIQFQADCTGDTTLIFDGAGPGACGPQDVPYD